MVSRTRAGVKQRKPLITAQLLATAASNGTGLDLRGIDFWHQPTLRDRALLRVQAERLTAYRIGDNSWVVPSGTDAGHAYVLQVYGQNGSSQVVCSCPGGKSGKVCKHAELVRAKLAQAPKPNLQQPAERLTDLYRESA